MFHVMAMLEVTFGLFSSIVIMLCYVILGQLSIFHSHVTYLLRWALLWASVTNVSIAMHGVYNLAIVFHNHELIPVNRLLCFTIYLIPYLVAGKTFLLSVGLIIGERFWAMKKHDFSDNQNTVKMWIKLAALVSFFISTVPRICDILDILQSRSVETSNKTIQYCSYIYIETNPLIATTTNVVTFLLSVSFLVGGTVLYVMYTNELNSLVSKVSTGHYNLQKRYQTTRNIRTMQVLLWILTPTLLLAIFASTVVQFKSHWLLLPNENKLIFTQNINDVLTAVESAVLATLLSVSAAPEIREKLLVMLRLKTIGEHTVPGNIGNAVSVINLNNNTTNQNRDAQQAVQDLVKDWLEMEKQIGIKA